MEIITSDLIELRKAIERTAVNFRQNIGGFKAYEDKFYERAFVQLARMIPSLPTPPGSQYVFESSAQAWGGAKLTFVLEGFEIKIFDVFFDTFGKVWAGSCTDYCEAVIIKPTQKFLLYKAES